VARAFHTDSAVTPETVNFREKKLYHQIHPLKLGTDIGVTPIFLFFLWHHQIARALLVGFLPPVIVSAAMMIWPPDLERLKNSSLGNYVSKYMTPTIEAVRFLTLVPMAWGAWTQRLSLIGLGLLVLLAAWCNGLIFRRGDSVLPQNPSFVDVPGVRLAYDKSGLGAAPLVFLHGGLLDRRQWDGQFEYFASKCCVIRYDMRSAGQSETSPSAEPITHHEDLFHFLHALKIQHVSLVGLSNYAVALDFTIAYPKLVEKLVLVSPGLRDYEPRDPWVKTKFAAMRQSLVHQDLSGAVEVFLTMWVDGPHRTPAEVNPQVRERVREMVTRSFHLSRLAPNCKGLEPPAAGRLSEVRVPTLVAPGENDAPDIHAIGQLIHESVVGSKVVKIRDVGHTLVMEKPDEFNRVVADFLQD
jgi:3-oxoadipate enol-lactonase